MTRQPPKTKPRVLIIVQNLPVPFDRRVWLECRSLTEAGYDVTVVCPQGEGTEADQVIEGVRILAYRPHDSTGTLVSFLVEYAYSFLATARLVARARRSGTFSVMQACNPPDIFWPIARLLRLVDGTRFVFDHHDLCPELYRSRFADKRTLAYRGLLLLERATFSTADKVTSTNDSYASVAIHRGGKAQQDVVVVRTGPDPRQLKAGQASPELRRGRTHLVAYVGVMGPQDGVDIILRAADTIVNRWHRHDIQFLVMGRGDCYEALVEQRDSLRLQDHVEMPGRVSDEDLAIGLSSADLGLSPDPLSPLNDVSTMNKTMEYMAFGLPVVAFDLRETRVSAQEAARYVTSGDATGYAKAIVELLDRPEQRRSMGEFGRRRVEQVLAWEHQQGGYLSTFDELVDRRARDTSLSVDSVAMDCASAPVNSPVQTPPRSAAGRD